MKTMNKIFTLLIIVILASCSSHKVERVSPDEQIDLSGRWNDTDSRLIAEAMVEQVLNQNWIENFKSTHNAQPVVVVGLILNKSHEHIDATTFIKDIEREFIKSGRVRVVTAGEKREELRRERAGQQEFASPETAKSWGRELGADFMMNGDISSIVDTYKKERVNFYKINLELANLETNELVWIGDKEIKKYVVK